MAKRTRGTQSPKISFPGQGNKWITLTDRSNGQSEVKYKQDKRGK